MKVMSLNYLLRCFMLVALSASWSPVSAIDYSGNNEWENPTMFERGKEKPHAWFKTSYVKSLNGMWRFRYDDDIKQAPTDFYLSHYDDSKWAKIPVPSNWELQGFGTPIFINFKYNWTPNPPYIDIPNPVGTYRTSFTVPNNWKDREVMLHFGSITGYARVYVNGKEVGMTKCSKTPAEFDITPYLMSGNNNLAVQVYRYHDGSYMEDQDFWRITGIEREVYLQAYQKSCVWDYAIEATPTKQYRNGNFKVDVVLRKFGKASTNGSLLLQLLDANGKVVYQENKKVEGQGEYLKLSFAKTIKQVKLWSAEKPNLYKCQLIYGKDTVKANVGFREVKIENSRLLVNGKIVYIKGVNRHETNDSLGHVPTKDIMMHDLKLLKSLNINAVRCSHYPNDPLWYDLCDEYGIYLVDEANIETHGMGSVPYFSDTIPHPAYRPEWVAAHEDRIHRMYYRDRSHPSIIGWSLGNECGNGKVFHDQYKWLKENDKTRYVQFEQAWEDWNTDVVALMYPSFGRMKDYAKSGKTRPFIMCEYAHSQGNSTGDFHDLWDVIKQAPNLQGGFIWDFQDQGFKRTIHENTDHRTYYMYNGGMGSYVWPDDENSGTDGIIASDGTPKPAAWEVKKVYQDVNFKLLDWKTGKLMVKNEYAFTSLADFNFAWTLHREGKQIGKGTFIANTAAGDSTVVRLRLPQMDNEAEYTLEVYALMRQATPLQEAGSEVAKEQFVRTTQQVETYAVPTSGELKWKDDGKNITFENDSVSGAIDRRSGKLWSLSYKGKNVLVGRSSLEPYFWRAPNDNDFGNRMPERSGVWRSVQTNTWVKKCTVGKMTEEGLPIDFVLCLGDIDQEYQLDYLIRKDGSVKVSAEMNTTGRKLPEMPRFGMRFSLTKDFENVCYYGRGPIENYSDRKTGQFIGLYDTTVSDMYYPYARPQQNSNHTDVRWAKLTDANQGICVKIQSGDGMDFSALHFMDEDFDPGNNRKMRHTKDLYERKDIYVIIGNVMRGLGGDDSWGAFPHEEYRHYAGKYKFSYVLSLEGK